MAAAYAGDADTFAALLGEEPELAKLGSSQSHPTLLQFVAVEAGLGKIDDAVRFAALLIDAGASLEDPLVAAASVGAQDVLDAIVAAGAPIEARQPWTALEEALYWGRSEMAAHLVAEHGALIPSLRAAAGLGELGLMEAFFDDDGQLLEHDGVVYFPFGQQEADEAGALAQALIVALQNRQYDAGEMLVEQGVDLDAVAPGFHENASPLAYATFRRDEKLVAWLREQGATKMVKF
jgi:hypothetical protein